MIFSFVKHSPGSLKKHCFMRAYVKQRLSLYNIFFLENRFINILGFAKIILGFNSLTKFRQFLGLLQPLLIKVKMNLTINEQNSGACYINYFQNIEIILSTVAGPVNSKNKSWIQFVKLNLQHSFSLLAHKSRFKA